MTMGVSQDAEDKKAGMTLDEVGRFVQHAMRMGMAGDAKVVVRIGFSSQIQRLEITGSMAMTEQVDP